MPSVNKIDRAKLKRELEEYGRKLHLMWHFRNDKRTLTAEKFRPSLLLIQGVKTLSLKIILVAWRRDYWT